MVHLCGFRYRCARCASTVRCAISLQMHLKVCILIRHGPLLVLDRHIIQILPFDSYRLSRQSPHISMCISPTSDFCSIYAVPPAGCIHLHHMIGHQMTYRPVAAS